MWARVRGWIVLVWGSLSMAGFFLISLPVMYLTRSGEMPMWFARHAWSISGLWLAGARVRVVRATPLPDGPVVFASNHESALDIWVHLATLPRSFRFIAKKELFELPIFGWYMRIGGHVPVDRHNRTQAVASLRHAAELVRGGTSVVVYPEGTRSRDGRIHPFKKGPFVVALEAGVPIVPVAISGTGAITPKAAIAVYPGEARIAWGEAVRPSDHPDRVALLAEVRRRVIALHVECGGAGGDVDDAVAVVGQEG
jgi:1-acyl-sn-glycerol-3-phosphate acyltransferase